MKIYNDKNLKRIGTYADNIPNYLVSYAPGIDNWPTAFAVNPNSGRVFAFVDKKNQHFDELGLSPTLGDEHKYIIKHGQDVTDRLRELLSVADFHAQDEQQ